MNDEFQDRYLDHQKRKSKSLENFDGNNKIEYSLLEQTTLKEVIMNRRSQRVFNDISISDEEMEWILRAIQYAPSSCNRQAIYVKEVKPTEIEQLLVGGKNWINKANKVLFLFASKEAYKSPNEKGFMPYLDAGFAAQNIYLMCEVLGIGCCFVNPNIREENKELFKNLYNQEEDYFCGAVALGHYNKKAKEPPHRELAKVIR